MKSYRKRMLLLIAAVCMGSWITIFVEAAENKTDNIGMVIGVVEEEGEPVFLYPAFGVSLPEPCAVTCEISEKEREAADVVCFAQIVNDNIYEIELADGGASSGSGLSIWELKDASQADSREFASLEYAHENEKVTAAGFSLSDEGELSVVTAEMTLTGWKDSVMETDGYPANILCPAPILNESGETVGVLLEGNIALDWLGSEETFYGEITGGQEPEKEEEDEERREQEGSRGEEKEGLLGYGSIADIALAGGIAGLAAFLVKRKKKAKESKEAVQSAADQQPTVQQPTVLQEVPEPVQELPKLWIAARNGYMNGRVYQVGKGEITIGRNVGTDICYPKETPGVSRIHAKLYWQGDRLMLMDCNSTSGTFIKRLGRMTPMKPEEIKPGDIFYIGEEKNSFEVKN